MKTRFLLLSVALLTLGKINAESLTMPNGYTISCPGPNFVGGAGGTLSGFSQAQYAYNITRSGPFQTAIDIFVNGKNWPSLTSATFLASTLNFSITGTIPAYATCGQTESIRMDIVNVRANQVVCSATFYFTKASLPAITGPTLVCSSPTSYSVANTVPGPYTWTSSNPAFTIPVNGSNNITLNSSATSIGTVLTVSAANVCPQSLYIFKGVPPAPDNAWVDLTDPTETIHCFYTAFVGQIPGATSYVWTSPYALETFYSQGYMRLQRNSTYTLTVKAKNSCGTSAAFTNSVRTGGCPNVRTGIIETADQQQLSVFPNPATSFFQIAIPSNGHSAQVRIMNAAGQIVKNISTLETTLTVSSIDMPPGIYFITINSADFNANSKIQIIK